MKPAPRVDGISLGMSEKGEGGIQRFLEEIAQR
jgi:hypothetical protein